MDRVCCDCHFSAVSHVKFEFKFNLQQCLLSARAGWGGKGELSCMPSPLL